MITVKPVAQGNHFENALRLSFPYNPDHIAKVKQLAHRWYIPTSREWEIPSYELPNLVALVGMADLNLVGVEAPVVAAPAPVPPRERVMEAIAFTFKTEPFPHQIAGFEFGTNRHNYLLADEQGLGKTKQTIDVAVAKKQRGEVKKCLIVCGVNGVKYNWQREIATHSDERGVVFDGKTSTKRVEQIKAWLNGGEFFGIINIEAIRSKTQKVGKTKVETNEILLLIVKGIERGVIGMVVVDEIHKAKNWSSQQGKALQKLAAANRVGLTGTPIMNKAEDLWNVLYWLGAERRSFWGFRKRYCVMGGWCNKEVVGHQNLPELHENLKRVMLRRKKEECLNLPEKLRSVEFVEMSARHKLVYRQIRDGLIAQIDDIALNPNPLTALLRLRQCTSGLIGEENPKLDRLREMLEDDIIPNGRKAVIFSQWEQVTAKVKEALAEYKPAYITGSVGMEKRDAEVQRFQTDPNCKVIIGTIGAMGTGITLTAGSYVVFLDKAWTPADNEQAEDRAHRIGTTQTVNVITLVAQGTIDQRIEEILAEKKDTFNKVVEGRFTAEERRQMLERLLEVED